MACLQEQTQVTFSRGPSSHAAELARFSHTVEKNEKKQRKETVHLLTALELTKKEVADAKQEAEGGGQVTGQGATPGAGNGLLQINAGPAALAMHMIFEAMDLYASIINLQKEQRVSMIKTQADTAWAQSKEMRKEGKAAWDFALAAGITTASTAVVSLAAYATMEGTMGRNNKEDEMRINEKLKPMKSIDDNLMEKPWGKTAGERAGSRPVKGISDQMRSLENGDYSKANLPDDQLEDLQKRRGNLLERRARDFKSKFLKGEKRITQKDIEKEQKDYSEEAIKRMKTDPEAFAEFKKEFNSRHDGYRQEALSITNSQTRIANFANMASTISNSLGQGASTAINGYGQNVQKQCQADATIDQMASSMAGGNSSETAQAMAKADDAQKQEVQILREIDRSNMVQV